MQKRIEKMTSEQSEGIVQAFLKSFGERLKSKRKKVNISQEELAECLGIEPSALSRYESGTRDMHISALPLASIYCGFPMYELFPREESQEILNAFSCAVRVTVERHRRQTAYRFKRSTVTGGTGTALSDKRLKGLVYDVNGKEIYEPVEQKKTEEGALREKYRSAEVDSMTVPCSGKDFCTYIEDDIPEKVGPIADAGRFLEGVLDTPKKNGLRDAVADYIIDEILISRIVKEPDDERLQRMYSYYTMLYRQYQGEKKE